MDNTYVQPTRTTHNSIHYTNMADADRSFGFVNTIDTDGEHNWEVREASRVACI